MPESPQPRRPRSPIKDFIRPRPGSALRDQYLDGFNTILYWAAAAGGATVVVTVAGLLHWLIPTRPLAEAYISAVLGIWLGLGLAFWRNRSQLRNLRLAIEGEAAVAQTLDELRACGYQILHSIRCDSFDIDHAVIGPAGVFAIETKTISKRGGAEEQVQWDGNALLVGGRPLHRDPITQAKAVARQLAAILKDYTGESVFVQPAVVFPGWFVVNKAPSANVWVQHPTMLVKQIKSAPPRFDAQRVTILTNALNRYQQDEERRRLRLK